jgi:hypothetical protein
MLPPKINLHLKLISADIGMGFGIEKYKTQSITYDIQYMKENNGIPDCRKGTSQ